MAKKKAVKKRVVKRTPSENALRVSLLKKHLKLPHGYHIVKRKKK